jgi:site-specific DNA-methyltransferase (adenine-specific)
VALLSSLRIPLAVPALVRPWQVLTGDCRAVLSTLPDNSLDSCVTDPPYELGFMGKSWDKSGIAYDLEVWGQVLRVLKPGAYLAAFGASRTFHRLACAIEDAGFELRDTAMFLHGVGFPKSLNLGDGRGTALKPAFEPIVLARKPLDGTHAEVLARWGTGALNIDACRVPGEKPNYVSVGASRDDDRLSADFNMGPQKQDGLTSIGRWPANVIHDGSEEVLAAFPAAGGQLAKASSAAGNKIPNVYSSRRCESNGAEPRVETNKSAARFFYCAKASKADREEGCEDLPIQTGGDLTGRADGTDGLKSPRAGAGRGGGRRNPHPTVKPTELMRWVVRLVTPAGGQVIDPFTGSGSTGKACVLEGRQFVGVEMSPEYVKIAEARIRAVEGRAP